MTDSRDQLRDRFRKSQQPSLTRRLDFKGYRSRINLRVPEALSAGLRILRLVTGEPTNAYCQRVLTEAVEGSIKEQRAKHGGQAWEAFEECAKAGQRPEHDR